MVRMVGAAVVCAASAMSLDKSPRTNVSYVLSLQNWTCNTVPLVDYTGPIADSPWRFVRADGGGSLPGVEEPAFQCGWISIIRAPPGAQKWAVGAIVENSDADHGVSVPAYVSEDDVVHGCVQDAGFSHFDSVQNDTVWTPCFPHRRKPRHDRKLLLPPFGNSSGQ